MVITNYKCSLGKAKLKMIIFLGFLEEMGLKMSFENWQNLDDRGVFLGRGSAGVSPMGKIGAEKACDISLGK